MKSHRILKMISVLIAATMVMAAAPTISPLAVAAAAEATPLAVAAAAEVTPLAVAAAAEATPFEKYGKLQVKTLPETQPTRPDRSHTYVCDERGNPVQLRGMCIGGIQWDVNFWPIFFADEVMEAMAGDWKADVIRVAMYVGETGYEENPPLILSRMEKLIKAITKAGMYCIVDWHVHVPGNPEDPVYLNAGMTEPWFSQMPADFQQIKIDNPAWDGAMVFFAYIAQKYGHQGNIIYEPANEPNGSGVNWTLLKRYFDRIVGVIRLYDEDSMVLVGNSGYSQNPQEGVANPVIDPANTAAPGGIGGNGREARIMYTSHLYVGTHDYNNANGDPSRILTEDSSGSMKNRLRQAMEGGRAVFLGEWGASASSGDDGLFITMTDETLMPFLDKYKIGWTNWYMSNKVETAAAFYYFASLCPPVGADGIRAWSAAEMTRSGNYVRSVLRGEPKPWYDDSNVITDFEPNSIYGQYSPNLTTAVPYYIEGNGTARLSGVTKDLNENWVNFMGIDKMYGPYHDLKLDVYLTASDVKINGDSDTVFVLDAEFTLPNGNAVQMPAPFEVPYGAFGDAGGGLLKATVRMPLAWPGLAQPAGNLKNVYNNNRDRVRDVKISFALTDESLGAAVNLDMIAFSTYHVGDTHSSDQISDAEVGRQRGAFLGFPYRFESFVGGTTIYANDRSKEGWYRRPRGGAVFDTQITVETVGDNDHALCLPIKIIPGGQFNRWEYGAAIITPTLTAVNGVPYNTRAWWNNIAAVAMDIYMEPGKATQGKIVIEFGAQNLASNFYMVMPIIDPVNGGDIVVTPEGKELLKYIVVLPWQLAGAPGYSNTSYPTQMRIFIGSEDCDYVGNIYFDNINMLTADRIHTVAFESNGGTEVTPILAAGGGTINKPADPIREGYVFLGWYKDDDCEDAWNFGEDTVTADITLYAKWERIPVLLNIFLAAGVKKTPGNTNELTITLTKMYDDESEIEYSETFTIKNNAEGVYQVGPHKVFADIKGNDQVRRLYIVGD